MQVKSRKQCNTCEAYYICSMTEIYLTRMLNYDYAFSFQRVHYVLPLFNNELELDLKSLGPEDIDMYVAFLNEFSQWYVCMYRLQWNLGREDVDNEYTSIMDNGGMYRLHYPN